MAGQKPASRRHFTEAARIAALEAKRRKREKAQPRGTPEVYVVRGAGARLPFGWEIRRFGAIVIERGEVGYATPMEARSAGEEARSAASKETRSAEA